MAQFLRRQLSLWLLLYCSAVQAWAADGLLPDRDSLPATNTRGNHYFSLTPQLAYNCYRDQVNSPLTYRTVGLLLAAEVGFENRSMRHNGYLRFFFADQNMTTDEAPYTGALPEKFMTARISTSRCYRLDDWWHSRIHYELGYVADFEYNHQINDRLVNAAYTYAIWLNAGVANRIEFPFTIPTGKKIAFIRFKNPEQHLLIAWQVNVPLAGLITRPNYAGIRHFANGEFLSNLSREMMDHLTFTSLNHFVALQSQIELQAPLGNNNRLRIAYAWNGFNYNKPFSEVAGVTAAFEVGLLFRLDGRKDVDLMHE